MAKRKWYVVTVGRDIGVFPTWLEAAPLVKGVPNAIHQSFLTRAEATRMFAEQQARGTTRIVDPDLDIIPAATQPQRVWNYSAPSPFPPVTSTFGVAPIHRGHHRSPLSVHPTTTSSRNRTSDGTPSPILSSDRRAPIVPGTSHSSPATWTSNPRSALNDSPSQRRFEIIQAALEQASRSASPARSQVRPADRTPLLPNIGTSNSQSLAPVPGPSTGARTSGLTAESISQPSSSSRGLQRTPLHTPDMHHRAAFDSPGRSNASPRAIVTTPEWLPPYPTARTPSPDSESSPRMSSPGPSDELLSPLSNVNLNSFALDNPPQRRSNTAERNTPSLSVNSSIRRLNRQSPSIFANGTHQSSFTSTSASDSGSTHLHDRPRRIAITHDTDPRSPILSQRQVPELAHDESALELSSPRPSPQCISQPLTSLPLSNFSINGHGSSLLFRH